ncbi:hypothetical protein [Nisaea sp.]|uniref:O-linked N-acetylglucosamine transferase, SPINDLY family protein n=1 Tax=Nisaea sp. TaxID=2024842 RepID=UPI0032F04E1C
MIDRTSILDGPGNINPYIELLSELSVSNQNEAWQRRFLETAGRRLLQLDRGATRALILGFRPLRDALDLGATQFLAPVLDAVLESQVAHGDVPFEAPNSLLERRDDPALALRVAQLVMGHARRRRTEIFQRPAWAWFGDRKLRVGYVCSDLNMHPVGLSVRSLMLRHDRDRFDITVYDRTTEPKQPVQGPVKLAADQFRAVPGLSVPDLRKMILSDGIDILVDLSGAPLDPLRDVFCLGAAPLQVSMLGYPGGIGQETVDYYVADPVTVPPSERSGFSECLILMPGSFLPVDDQMPDEDPPPRSALGLPEDAFVMAAFNRLNKLDLSTIRLWFTCLRRIPNTVLWCAVDEGPGRSNLLKLLSDAGLDPDRVVVTDRVGIREHRARISAADIALDPIGYNGGYTTALAIQRGVPVVTLPGHSFAWRMSAGILSAAGLPEGIAESPADYFARVERFASDPLWLASCRNRLLEKTSSLFFNPGAYIRALEEAFMRIANNRRNGLKDEDVVVSARSG